MPRSKQLVECEKLRLVLDTNILVSGILSHRGPCAAILDFILSHPQALIFLLTEEILAEYQRVLPRARFKLKAHDVLDFLNFLFEEGGFVDVSRTVHPSSIDPGDNKFIACAIQGKAAFLITGNLRHFSGIPMGETRVVSPREFVTAVLSG